MLLGNLSVESWRSNHDRRIMSKNQGVYTALKSAVMYFWGRDFQVSVMNYQIIKSDHCMTTAGVAHEVSRALDCRARSDGRRFDFQGVSIPRVLKNWEMMVVQSFTSDYRLFLSWSDSLRGNDSLKKLSFFSSTQSPREPSRRLNIG